MVLNNADIQRKERVRDAANYYLQRYHNIVVLYFLLADGGHEMRRELSRKLL